MPIMTTSTVVEQLELNEATSFVANPRLFQTQYRVVTAARAAGNLASVLHAPDTSDFNSIPVGLEIEFDGGDDEEIAVSLNSAGLMSQDYQQSYHDGAGRDYVTAMDVDTHQNQWRFEEDGSVSGGEVITPPMLMTPISMGYLNRAVGFITASGGTTSRHTGMHTNVTSDSLDTVEKWNRLFSMWAGFEDTLYRLFANPLRSGAHRRNGYDMAPNTTVAESLAAAVRQNSSYGRGAMNTSNVEANGRGYIEFRSPDSSLHLPTMLTQMMVLTTLVEKASDERLDAFQFEPRPRGTQRKIMKDREQEPSSRMVGEQWTEATENVRTFCDLLFGDDVSKKSQVATLFAMNKVWAFSHRR